MIENILNGPNIHVIINGINNRLIHLRELSLSKSLNEADNRKVFFDYIIDLKDQYLLVKSIASNETFCKSNPPPMRMYISRQIHPNQMEGWVAKLQFNLIQFLNKPAVELQDQLSFINDQSMLLDKVVQVLNGDAYFLGCPHFNV